MNTGFYWVKYKEFSIGYDILHIYERIDEGYEGKIQASLYRIGSDTNYTLIEPEEFSEFEIIQKIEEPKNVKETI